MSNAFRLEELDGQIALLTLDVPEQERQHVSASR